MNQRPIPLRQPQIPGEHPDETARRHATALSEVQKMRHDYADMQLRLLDAERKIDQLTNMVEVLKEGKAHYRQHAAVYQRKLIRLSANLAALGKLSEEATAIMKDAKEFEEAMTAEEPERSAAGQDEPIDT